MESPVRLFTERLLAEIAKLEGGVPAVAEAMGIDPRVINDLANGELPSPEDLRAIYEWLARCAVLTRRETEDYHKLRTAASTRKGAELERAARSGGTVPGAASKRYLPTLPQAVGGLVILVLAVALSVLVTTAIVKAGNGGTVAGKTTSPSVEPSSPAPPTPSLTPTPSPVPSPSESGDVTAASSPGTSTSTSASPQVIASFHSDHISIAEIDSNSNGDGSYYKNLSVNPPVTTTNLGEGDVDVLIGGSPPSVTMQASNNATIGMWHQSTMPTYSECLQTAEAAGVGEIDVNLGQTVCVMTSSGAIASLKLTSINGFDSADFSGTIWYPPSSP